VPSVLTSLLAAFVDPQRLTQALHELLQNALFFTPEGGAVRVHVYAAPLDAAIPVPVMPAPSSAVSAVSFDTLGHAAMARGQPRVPLKYDQGQSARRSPIDSSGGSRSAETSPMLMLRPPSTQVTPGLHCRDRPWWDHPPCLG
jgi:hypothetical protein